MGPHQADEVDSGQTANNPQPDKFDCIGEASPSLSSTRPLHSRLIQSPSTQAESEVNPAESNRVDSCSECDLGDNDGESDGDQVMEDVEDDEQRGDDEEDEDDEDEEEVADLDLDALWMTTDQLIKHVTELGANGLTEEYSAVCSIKTNDPCTAFRLVPSLSFYYFIKPDCN